MGIVVGFNCIGNSRSSSTITSWLNEHQHIWTWEAVPLHLIPGASQEMWVSQIPKKMSLKRWPVLGRTVGDLRIIRKMDLMPVYKTWVSQFSGSNGVGSSGVP